MDPVIRRYLHKVTHVHSHLCAVVRLYGDPTRAGGQSLQGEAYAARAARGDRTLLQDALTVARDALIALLDEVEREIANVEPTDAKPGTAEKIAEMARRALRGQALFSEHDGLWRATGAA